jgi:BirA family biotin operon repressor/biotin-[acetyl-CoA-carboxylase] ligase
LNEKLTFDYSENINSRQLDIHFLQDCLNTEILGNTKRLMYVPVIDSTNSFAMKLAREGSEEGVVVLTDKQTAGKGRQGRRWLDVAGWNALSSTILRPAFPPHFLIMIASLAVVSAITDTCGIAATIKWPNDVLIGLQKVAGILIETSHDHEGRFVAILGIGVNVNGRISQFTEENSSTADQTTLGLATKATTLEEEYGQAVRREVFIAHLLQHIETYYLALQQEAQQDLARPGYGPIARRIRDDWRNQLSTLGRTVQVRQGEKLLSGVAEDVNDQGELLLRSHSGEYTWITWGDVG